MARSFRSKLRQVASNTNRGLGRRTNVALARYPAQGSIARELKDLLRLFKLTQVVDVGAHVGGFAERLRADSSFSGRIVSFEPSPAAFAVLEQKVERDRAWTALPYGLGSNDTTLTLNHVSGDGQFDSIRTLSEFATSYQEDLTVLGSTEIEVHRLESIWPAIGGQPHRTLLKIDTQGFDMEVVDGCGDLLDVLPAIVMEVPVQPIYDGASTMADVLRMMAARGFEITGAFPIHRYSGGRRVIEFDCSFVNVRSCR